MLETYFRNLTEGREIRKTLIALRKDLKKENTSALTSKQLEILRQLLAHEDPKVRKNAALILGEQCDEDSLEALEEAYEAEEKLFVKADYLEAIGHLHYGAFLGRFKNRMLELMAQKPDEASRKHRSAEIHALRSLILQAEKPKKHRFTGWKLSSDVILTVTPGLEELTSRQLPEELQSRVKVFKGGVEIITEDLEPIRAIRTVRGMLFRFCKNPLAGKEPEEIARTIASAGLFSFIDDRHAGEPPYYFRIDLKAKMEPAEKSKYIGRLADALEEMTDYKLQNAASDYEFEIRLTQGQKGGYYAYLRLPAIPDRRFTYRKEVLPTSMHPVRAAEMIALVRDHLTEYGIVLDPMCGNGTLLLERSKAARARSMYGVDIYRQAVEAGRKNAAAADVPIYFINRDFGDFRHEYRFDEILTQFPTRTEKTDEEALERLYMSFVRRIPDWMKEDGKVIALCTEPAMMKRAAASTGYLQETASYPFSEKTGEKILVYRYRK